MHCVSVISVNFSKSIEDLVKEGEFNRVDSNITSRNFLTKQNGVWGIPMHFASASDHDFVSANAEIACQGFKRQWHRPAEMREFISFIVQDIDKERENFIRDIYNEFPIIALGCVWQSPDGYRYVPQWYGKTRSLTLKLESSVRLRGQAGVIFVFGGF